MLLRDWRGGELGVLFAALVIAVTIVSGISAFTTRLQNSLEQESHRFLAADRVVSSSSAVSDSWGEYALSQGLQVANTLSFPSMVYAGDEDMVLASVKAVSDNYPLRGELLRSDQPFAAPQAIAHGPAAGTVWIDSRLFALLDIDVGAQLTIGEADFSVTAAIRSEPDQGSSFLGFGPRVLMNYTDIPATEVVQVGSRVEYRLLLAGDAGALETTVEWLEPRLENGERLLDVASSQQSIGSALQRAEQFLLLAGSLGVVLAAVAIALGARRFSERHYDYVAIMKSLGATSGRIARLYGSSLLILGAAATLLGSLLGWSMQSLFFVLFGDALPVTPASSGPRPYLMGMFTALVCLASFAWPPLRRLGKISPLRVLRRDMPGMAQRTVQDYLVGLGAIILLMLWYSRDVNLTLAVLAGLACSALVAAGAATLLLRGGRLAGMRAGSIWRLALAGLQRRGAANTLQVVIFSMAIMLLLILVLVRTSLIEEWQTQLPEGTPNHFLINISPEQVNPVREALNRKAVLSQPLYPMVRGRVTHINGEALGRSDDPEEGRRERETNLTWSDAVPPNNEIIAGSWWDADSAQPLVSLEEGIADSMKIKVGDTVTYTVGARELSVTVASIRRLDWGSMQPNFFMVFPPAVLQGYPATFMTSFYLGGEEKQFLNQFIREFPTVTVIEMDVVVQQVRAIVSQVSAAIELVLGVILLAGALVLIAGVQASVDARLLESAILRALGAPRKLILGSLVIEFGVLGLFAGSLATLAAELSVYILQTQALDMSYQPSPLLWFLGPLVGITLIGGLGVWNCRRVISSPPLTVLREL
ncbi:FtsX-like permease family protein [Halieaceae bacterium IMCC14734]|uniref:FtsX-like permease family protein n=2 Tax=Candidatus Litorirhabdus singularis TaxID=2518993 RepID=A0ABT3TGU7_9GAMM|nr:FtsX-like permease family protein [Candidatus Litorirhabdus singularis]